ncbi:helix-turn-helix domain-containing protein [Anaerovorax odorimutans]|uniref:Helix-turn-helix domain-containing protein n=1 Tax=Anaerovorax odorimutans TaxID=109327 RepID=A0ABT1RT32_9FIRM|nr:helix-turn-helix transcriptional regulator [Anaerovorax odorimutans]MCQ4638320.1 helix-turn-helix domain-containing protein [Anaerovorax odorimutans]
MKKKTNLKEIDLKKMGRRIRTQREAIHMTRSRLAAKLGVSSKFVADIEYGDKGVSIQTLYRLSQILNLSADYILAGDKAVSGNEDPETERIKENIMGPLSACSVEQLKCMEQIARYYVEGIVGKEE